MITQFMFVMMLTTNCLSVGLLILDWELTEDMRVEPGEGKVRSG